MQTFDAIRFTRDHRIPTADSDDKHYREGWLNVPCPFCTGNPGFHLGFKEDSSYWNCYRCGWHNTTEVVRELTGLSWKDARALVEKYGGRPVPPRMTLDGDRPLFVQMPIGTRPMEAQHRKYLRDRDYNSEVLEDEWGLLGTGPIGPYKFRIIAPIHHEGRVVSYQGRDITDRNKAKYKACPADREVIPHAHLLYGLDKAVGHSVVVVEGITDVWRLGPGAVATFGVEWHRKQVRLLRRFLRVFIMYDQEETAAAIKAKELAYSLAGLGLLAEVLLWHTGDPADLTDSEARAIMRELTGF